MRMARKGLHVDGIVVKCKKDNCNMHMVHTGDLLPYVEGMAKVLKIREDGLKVVFLERLNGRKKRIKTGYLWQLRKKNVCIMPLPKRFNTVEDWLASLD
jgi:hypothetical protein